MSQGMTYAVTISQVASPAAAFDAFEINAPAGAAVKVHFCSIGQSSDYGDSAAEGLGVNFIIGYNTSGSGGSAATPVPLQSGFAAAGSTCEVMNTTQASGGSPLTRHSEAFNAQIGYLYRPTPEERMIISPGGRLVVAVTAPADAITISGTLIFEEIGG